MAGGLFGALRATVADGRHGHGAGPAPLAKQPSRLDREEVEDALARKQAEALARRKKEEAREGAAAVAAAPTADSEPAAQKGKQVHISYGILVMAY